MITQVELEKELYAFGRKKASTMMQRNENAGRAETNPYANALYRRYIFPLAEAVRDEIEAPRPGRSKAHVALLSVIDPEIVAYLTVRTALNNLMSGNDKEKVSGTRVMLRAIGSAVYHEHLLTVFKDMAPDLFFTVVNDLGRRMSNDERHKVRVFQHLAKEKGIPAPQWTAAQVLQVGAYLINLLESIGMVDVQRRMERKLTGFKRSIEVKLSDDVLGLVGEIKEMVEVTTPYYLPCVERPKHWTAINEGGYHTPEMRRMHPYAIKAKGCWSLLAKHDLSTVLTGLNTLQDVPYRINGRVLDAIKQVAKHLDVGEIISQSERPAPPKPDWLIGNVKKEDMTEDEQAEFRVWKAAKREWFSEAKLRGTKFGRLSTALRVAERFREFPEIFFVWFADFRGRFYPETTGVSPQGSDMQKALIEFAEGKPLHTEDAIKWFKIHGANLWGEDKVSLDERCAWVDRHKDHICQFASDPVAFSDWAEADSPLLFLAWCFEYAEWVKEPDTFLSHCAVGQDGSCNGLQNFSAMLRDEVGGRATNLIPADKPNDIYAEVAAKTSEKVAAAGLQGSEEKGYEDYNLILALWKNHKITRGLVKRCVMTLPYGATRFGCSEFILKDYLQAGKAPEFAKEHYTKASRVLAGFVWDSIGEVVVKAREAMDYLRKVSKLILAENSCISWVTPSGFPVYQFYQKSTAHQVRTLLAGTARIIMRSETEAADPNKHRQGISPNFVHSHDASHMHLTTVKAGGEGLSLSMVHDDYATHAADAQRLYEITREVFVAMYEAHDPLADLALQYDLPAPPEKGSLDLRGVLNSTYFFC